jgi:hypothetical protein
MYIRAVAFEEPAVYCGPASWQIIYVFFASAMYMHRSVYSIQWSYQVVAERHASSLLRTTDTPAKVEQQFGSSWIHRAKETFHVHQHHAKLASWLWHRGGFFRMSDPR